MQPAPANQYLIYGTGGHARVLASLVRACGREVLAYFDDQPAKPPVNEIPVMPYDAGFQPGAWLLTGIGNNAVRRDIAGKVQHTFARLVHPRATVAGDAVIGSGTVVLAGAVVQAQVKIGEQVVINMLAAVDHDAVIGDYASIYPGAYIGGGAFVGQGAVIGPNCVVARNARVPAWMELAPGTVFSER
ncbi:MAG TPA: hypothetical protein VGC22_08995, partial [Chitinophaga sp.]